MPSIPQRVDPDPELGVFDTRVFVVYDAQGNEFRLELPDALEYLRSGAYFKVNPINPTGNN